jgi:hypothetical protein
MAKARYEYCSACGIRAKVIERLPWPPEKPQPSAHVSPEQFWEHVARADLLQQALDLYDQLAAEQKDWVHTRRETLGQFWSRVGLEGRRAEAERVQAELRHARLSRREIQEALVARFQPPDGKVRVWPTPNPWMGGRICRKKADQVKLLALVNGAQKVAPDVAEARARLKWAQHREAERLALAAARKRAVVLKDAAGKNGYDQKVVVPSPPPRAEWCDKCHQRHGVHQRHCSNYIHGKSPIPCEEYCGGIVMPSSPTYSWKQRNLCDTCYAKARMLGYV